MKTIPAVALCALLLCMFTNANAKIRRVGYPGTAIGNTDYASLQSAHDAATAGDTLYIFPGDWSAGFSKRLTVIGYGYYIDSAKDSSLANVNLQTIKGSLSIAIGLQTGSDSCIFEGLDGFSLNNAYQGSAHRINTNNISIKRCNATIINIISDVHTNWSISQSIVELNSSGTLKNILVSNCIINEFAVPITNTSQTGFFTNNIFTANWQDPSFVYTNNIFLNTGNYAVTSSSTYNYNVFVGNVTSGLNGTHNKENLNQDSIFVGYTNQKKYSNDARWALHVTSPAKGAGENGIDCGIFSGSNPYKLSGIPPIPTFYKLSAPSTIATTNPYIITFSVRGNN